MLRINFSDGLVIREDMSAEFLADTAKTMKDGEPRQSFTRTLFYVGKVKPVIDSVQKSDDALSVSRYDRVTTGEKLLSRFIRPPFFCPVLFCIHVCGMGINSILSFFGCTGHQAPDL